MAKDVQRELTGFKCPIHKKEIKFNVVKTPKGISVQGQDICCKNGEEALSKKASESIKKILF